MCTIDVPEGGLNAYLKGFGLVRVFRKVFKDGDVSYYGSDVLKAGADEYGELFGLGWRIEQYHRGIKQCCGVESFCEKRPCGDKSYWHGYKKCFCALKYLD